MKVIYTYHGLQQSVGGVSRYFYEIIIRLQKKCDTNIVTFFLTNIYFKRILNRPDYFAKKWWRGNVFIRNHVEQFYLWFKLKTHSYDVIHNTEENVDVFNWTEKPVVITIHDMIPELFLYDKMRILKRQQIIKRASAIICVSHNTKKDLLTYFPEAEKKKIYVIYHGYNKYEGIYTNHNNFKYILYVGLRSSRYKNFLFMVKAISKILKAKNLKLICTGASFTIEENNHFKSLGLSNYIDNVGYVNDDELANLYHYAELFIYPSKYEGFGLPILEAYSNECPICISNTSCFPEIAGNAADYFDPDSQESIQNSVLRVLGNPEYRKELISKGAERKKCFSWNIAAEKTLSVYEELVNESR